MDQKTIKNALADKQTDPLLDTSGPACLTFDKFYQSDGAFIETRAWQNVVLKIFAIAAPVAVGLALLVFAWPLFVVLMIFAGGRFLFSKLR